MMKSVKASRSHAKEAAKGCRKREKSICGDGEGPSETKIHPLKYGYVSILGRKRVMEDPLMVVPPRELPGGYSFFAAYGGSCRAPVPDMCTDKLHHWLEKHTEAAEEKGLHWGKLLVDCFSCMYEDISGAGKEAAAAEGMMKFTAVVVGDEKGEVVVVNCGGSRAVLCSGGVASSLWSDDKVNQCPKHEAEVSVISQSGNSDDFLIIASDGLWSVVEKEMACEVVRKCLAAKTRRLPSEGGGASQAAAMLAELAIAKGSKDNISIIVLLLNSI